MHLRCIFERSLKLLHRRRDFGVRGLDVAVLRDRHVSVPQDSLDDFVGNSKLVKIRRQTARVRALRGDLNAKGYRKLAEVDFVEFDIGTAIPSRSVRSSSTCARIPQPAQSQRRSR